MTNFADGDANTQNMRCVFGSGVCDNTSVGDGNKQDLVCVKTSGCINESTHDSNTQKTVCVKSTSCINEGTDTKVISVKSGNCESHDPGSTTICVKNRIIYRPNS